MLVQAEWRYADSLLNAVEEQRIVTEASRNSAGHCAIYYLLFIFR